ncbi:LysR family transcriptional regulator [Alicyclobacillus fastidiosus]|uniref:LysR family transcriptional regulator n=1 Tax=Alicyclobacillus fastidiosus TaxID=392011 RepID=A0ABV5AGD3_9BACL|nr:LysR family transcriptional regulator [Alicyclobacillus fastidiosus]WEH08918.1 LysR family transcriptional regulator [Alicyclobacillus fastidiosus]
MELRHLEYFVVVADELHFGRAAARLQMTQPPLSQQIQQLERELGVVLLNRSNRHVELTNAGKVFLKEARDVLTRLDHAKHAARRAQQGMLGRLVLGFVGSATYDILPNVIRSYQERYPDVDISLHEMATPAQIPALRRGDIDVGVLRTPISDGELSVAAIERHDCVAVVPKSHRFAARSSVRLDELNGERWILIARSIWPGLHDEVLSACLAVGFTPSIRQEVMEVQTAVGLVAAGLGVSIVPSSTRNLHTHDVVYLKIEGVAPQVEMAIAWRRNETSEVVQAFLRMMKLT